MPRLVEAAAAALPTDSNNEAAALQANSKELEEPTPKKQRIKQHGIKTKSSKQTIVSASRPRNEEEKEELKKSGSMFGYINLPRGRPTKASASPSQSSDVTTEMDEGTSEYASAPTPSSTKKRAAYTNWNEGVPKMAMHIAMQSMLRDGNVNNAIAAAQEAYPTIPMKRSTVDSKFRVLQKSMANNQDVNVWNDLSFFDRARVDVLDADVRKVKGSLTTVADRDFLQSLATVRDNRNAGMGRKEIIAIISNMQGVPLKTAENHYDHLIRSKQLKELKKDGRVVTAQPTTTNRTAITTEKLLRTYCTQEEAWKEQAELNGWDESKMTASQLEAHKAVKDAHTMNLDE
jgi:hypothetical protein